MAAQQEPRGPDPARQQVRFGCFFLIFNLDQATGIAGYLKVISHDKSDWLAAIENAIVEQRAEWGTVSGIIVFIGFIVAGDRGAILVGQGEYNALNRCGGAGIDAPDSAAANGAVDHAAVQHARYLEFGGILRLTGYFLRAVDPVKRLAHWRFQGSH